MWFKTLFCKHLWTVVGEKFINDTDFSGQLYEVLMCVKCKKYSLSKMMKG